MINTLSMKHKLKGRKMVLNSWSDRSEHQGALWCSLFLPKKCALDMIGFMV